MSKIRLDKFLADYGLSTRSKVKRIISRGVVSVNGSIIKSADYKIDADTDEIKVNGENIKYEKHIYLMLNKPQGFITANKDHRHKTVMDLMPDEYKNKALIAVGRLDKDTEGLLIITNNGEFAHKSLSPKSDVKKRYIAYVTGVVNDESIKIFNEGVMLKDFTTKPSELIIKEAGDEYTIVEVVISEGKYHQIKRMFGAINCRVIYLRRVAFGNINLDTKLGLGECRRLSEIEMNYVNNIIKDR